MKNKRWALAVAVVLGLIALLVLPLAIFVFSSLLPPVANVERHISESLSFNGGCAQYLSEHPPHYFCKASSTTVSVYTYRSDNRTAYDWCIRQAGISMMGPWQTWTVGPVTITRVMNVPGGGAGCDRGFAYITGFTILIN